MQWFVTSCLTRAIYITIFPYQLRCLALLTNCCKEDIVKSLLVHCCRCTGIQGHLLVYNAKGLASKIVPELCCLQEPDMNGRYFPDPCNLP